MEVSLFRAFRRGSYPGSGLLFQVSSLRLPMGHSGPILTLSSAARTSLPSPRLLVADALLLHWVLPLGMLSVGLNYLFIFPPSYVVL